jgi:hypothetical protein
MTNEHKIVERERVLAESPGLRTSVDAVRLMGKLKRQLDHDDAEAEAEPEPFADLEESVTG